jgi:hypothetical protein
MKRLGSRISDYSFGLKIGQGFEGWAGQDSMPFHRHPA